jgi:hypothetical protein
MNSPECIMSSIVGRLTAKLCKKKNNTKIEIESRRALLTKGLRIDNKSVLFFRCTWRKVIILYT